MLAMVWVPRTAMGTRYMFGEDVIDGMNDFEIETDKITNKLNKEIFNLNSTLPYKDYL